MNNQTKLAEKQKKICEKYGSEFVAINENDMVAIAIDSVGLQPISGRREVKVTNDLDEITWFIYCGEYSDADDFFSPIHVSHLKDMLPEVLPYLALSEGFGFVIDNDGYEDVWCFSHQA
ncbi:immunity protein Imm33 domain-containing protein [Neisseria animaloris]|uniref:immunity protein Imm33 domain-containing protein n=1 Tax=Neisseria animaloris TaxID=326522 RepID=UPI000D35498B|nr:hypothetical protein [Neisseria animaloris]